MSFTTYDELVAEVLSFSERPDLAGKIDSFITLAEAEINRRIESLSIEDREYINTIAGQEYYVLPRNYRGFRALRARMPHGVITVTTPQAINKVKQAQDRATGREIFAAFHGNELQIYPIPADSYEIEMTFLQHAESLGVENPTNAILDRYPDLYLTGCMYYLSVFTKDKENASAYLSIFERLFPQIEEETYDRRWGFGGNLRTVRSVP